MSIRLTAAQERILREAVTGCVYRPGGSRIATCRRLEELGLLRGSRGAGAYTAYLFKPTVEGVRWVEKRDKEPS